MKHSIPITVNIEFDDEHLDRGNLFEFINGLKCTVISSKVENVEITTKDISLYPIDIQPVYNSLSVEKNGNDGC